MWRKMLRAKIHRATVTAGDIAYEGSITIDAELLRLADLVPYDAVDIYNVTNGSRFQTYVIPGAPGSGVIQINGAACRLAGKGDTIIIANYAYFTDEEARAHRSRVVLVDARNRVKRTEPPDPIANAGGAPGARGAAS